MGLGHSSLCLGKERDEDGQVRPSQSDIKCERKHTEPAWSDESGVLSVDLVRQAQPAQKIISRSSSTEASLDDETNSVTSSSGLTPPEALSEGADWSRKNSESQDELEEISDPIFIVKNTFIDVAMPPVGNSRVRSSSAPPSPVRGMEIDACVVEVAGAGAARFVWAGERENEQSILGTAVLSVPPTAAPTTAPARLPLFLVGLDIVIEGLTRSPEFNGLVGRVQGWEADTGRYDVMVHASNVVSEPFLVKVKAENIRRLDPPPPNFDASTKIPGSAAWDESDNLWDGRRSSEMTLVAGAHFQHYPCYRPDFHDNAWPSADAVSSPMHSIPVSPMHPMPADGGYSSHHQAGVFSPWWLPEAR